jgi:predicted DNA-binding transcriptional regulator AlpA
MPTNKENVLDDPVMFLSEVEKLTRLSGTTIWRRERAGKFPPRHKQGHYSVWFRSEIVAYLEALRAKASGPAPANVNANEARREAARRRRAARCLAIALWSVPQNSADMLPKAIDGASAVLPVTVRRNPAVRLSHCMTCIFPARVLRHQDMQKLLIRLRTRYHRGTISRVCNEIRARR